MTLVRAMRLDPNRLGEVADALAAARLPTADIDEPGRLFLRFDDDAGLIGFGGLEGDGADCLLRSLVIEPERRGQGLGRVVLARLEADARALGTARLHLLTKTAAPFFRADGYTDADRRSAPQSIAGSAQFRSLCPASASYMVKALTV